MQMKWFGPDSRGLIVITTSVLFQLQTQGWDFLTLKAVYAYYSNTYNNVVSARNEIKSNQKLFCIHLSRH